MRNINRLSITVPVLWLTLVAMVSAQSAPQPLATAKDQTFTAADLSTEARAIFERQDEIIAANRAKFLEQTIDEMVVEIEAKERKISAVELIDQELAKVPPPAEAKIAEILAANRAALAGLSESAARERVVEALMQEPKDKAFVELIDSLKAKHKFTAAKGVNEPGLKPTDVLFTIAGEPMTAKRFDEMNRFALSDVRAHIFETVLADLEEAIFNRLIVSEAAARGIDTFDLIKVEISDKLGPDAGENERSRRLMELQQRLFKKYAVKILLPQPARLVLPVSVDDDPAIGPANAPATVVMFIDYQCSACAAFSPTVKQVAEEYGSKVRLVVRDFPLESIHKNAFRSALAANAAHRQGKYFEFGALLYANQSRLDDASLVSFAEQLGLDKAKFLADISDPKNAAEVRADVADARKYGVSGTPTIFVNGVKLHTLSESRLRSLLDSAVKPVK